MKRFFFQTLWPSHNVLTKILHQYSFFHIVIVSKISLKKNADQKKEFHPIVPNLKYLSKAIELAVEIATF